jgi:hypothetical protein
MPVPRGRCGIELLVCHADAEDGVPPLWDSAFLLRGIVSMPERHGRCLGGTFQWVPPSFLSTLAQRGRVAHAPMAN